MMVNELLKEAKHKMKKAIQIIRDELSHIRTGRASSALVETSK